MCRLRLQAVVIIMSGCGLTPRCRDPLQILPTAGQVTRPQAIPTPSQQWAVGGYAFCHYKRNNSQCSCRLSRSHYAQSRREQCHIRRLVSSGGYPGDDYWPTYPTDKCYVGYNQRSGAGDQLTPPNNCEGSNTGFQVTRTGFGRYNLKWHLLLRYGLDANHPLPSDELRLSAAPAGQAIRLTWNITQPEAEYILGYELYRKTENGTFTRIAQIDKQGRMQYTHDDAYVAPNTRYFYQVGQHDVFGNVRYSNIVEAMLPSRGDAFSAQLQPNPITSEGSLMVNIPSEGMVAFTLYDAAGKLVAQHSWTLAAGTHQLDLAPILAQVAAGNYNAHVTFGSEVKTLRLIKLDHTR
jgi:hypothetical protein